MWSWPACSWAVWFCCWAICSPTFFCFGWIRGSVMVRMRNRWAVVCACVLGLLYGAAVFADVLAPYGYGDEDRNYSFCPPTPIVVWENGHFVPPFIYGRVLRFDEYRRRVYDIDPAQKYPVRFFREGRLFGVDAPGRVFLLCADNPP